MYICVYPCSHILRSHFGSNLGQGQATMADMNVSGKRLRSKTTPASMQDPTDQFLLSNPLVLELLSTDGLPALPDDARRHCVHYTMTRVHQKEAVQPSQLTRKKFWEILCLCFLEAYPDATSKTKSILQFGLTAQEKHKDAPREEDKSVHYHCATFSSEKYYWKRIRQIAWK